MKVHVLAIMRRATTAATSDAMQSAGLARSPAVSTVSARPARRSLVEILRATLSMSLDCTRENTAALRGATTGLNLHTSTWPAH